MVRDPLLRSFNTIVPPGTICRLMISIYEYVKLCVPEIWMPGLILSRGNGQTALLPLFITLAYMFSSEMFEVILLLWC
jgi:hypothetical protein